MRTFFCLYQIDSFVGINLALIRCKRVPNNDFTNHPGNYN